MSSTPQMTDDSIGDGSEAQELLRLETRIAEMQAEYSRMRRRRRLVPVLAIGGFILIVILSIATGHGAPNDMDMSSIGRWVAELSKSPTLAVALGFLVFVITLTLIAWTNSENSLSAEIELSKSKRNISAKLSESPKSTPGLLPNQPDTYFEKLVHINVNNLAEYYSLVKVHTNNSFQASLWAGGIGFFLIVVGVVAGFGGLTTATPAKLATVSGVLVEFIAGVFFYLYIRTVSQLKGYHDSLLSVQNVLLSFKLINDTTDTAARKDMTLQMCSYLMTGLPTSMKKPPEQGELRARQTTRGSLKKTALSDLAQ